MHDDAARGLSARRRQGPRPARDPQQARAADARRVRRHQDAPGVGGGAAGHGRVPVGHQADHPLAPREVRRQRLSRSAARGRDPARGADHRHRGRLRRPHHHAQLSARAVAGAGPRPVGGGATPVAPGRVRSLHDVGRNGFDGHRHRPGRLMRLAVPVSAALTLALAACERPGTCRGDYCGTLIFVTFSQPDILLPPVTQQAVSRDIHDQLFLKLADVGPALNTLGDKDFEPQLAERWEWQDSLTLVFHLSPKARWQDGPAVTARDVAFTFDAYTASNVDAPARDELRAIRSVTAVTGDSLAAAFRFRHRYAEMFFDAVYHMRILPAHLLAGVPRDQWARAAFGRAPVGDGPYRFVAWKAGESIELVADSTFFLGRPHIRRLIWRFTPDPQTALTQLVAGEADALEFLGAAANVERARGAPQLAVYPYRGTAYGYLGFNLTAAGDPSRPHPIFGDRDVRRALSLAVDRERLKESVFHDLALVPPAPVPQAWPLWQGPGDTTLRALPYDTAQAAALLARRGWRDSDGDGIRDRGGVKLAFHILVPTTSGVRRQ